jgi:hypothetical protein
VLRRDPDVRGDLAQRDRGLEGGVLRAEPQVARFGVERQQLVLAARLREVQPLGDPHQYVRPRRALVGDRAEPEPGQHDSPGFRLGHHRRARGRALQQIAERADVIARPGEPAGDLAAVGEQEVLANEAAQDRAAVDRAIAGPQERLAPAEQAYARVGLDRGEVCVGERADAADQRAKCRAVGLGERRGRHRCELRTSARPAHGPRV